MRLHVSYAGHVPDCNLVWYRIDPDIFHLNHDAKEIERLAYRIELVGKKFLGDDLHIVNTQVFDPAIGICVTKGISSGPRKSEFRDFLGWIAIFGVETGLATRAAIPRAN